jgi:TPR repeat protein
VIDPARVADLNVEHPKSALPRRGSGYRVQPGTVLTAAHVVRDATSVTVRFNADRPDEWSVTTKEWSLDEDVAVLVITPRPEDEALPVARFGRLPDRPHVFHAEAVGFPLWKLREDAGRYRDSHHAHGEIASLSNRREGTLELTVMAPSHTGEPKVSPWEGMSGAAVWVAGRIVGVVSKHYPTDGLGRLAACRIDTCLDDVVRTLLGLGEVPEIRTATPTELAAEAYQVQVRALMPKTLFDRDDELADLARFCLDDVPYAWWQAEPWAGKTALMASFAANPPPGCDVVFFFVNSRLLPQSDSDAFIEAMCHQLAALVGEPTTAPGPGDGVFRRLLEEATTRARELRRRLIMLVDGLDEDTSPQQHKPDIVSLLPDPAPELRVLVSSRVGLPLDDLDGEHPLRTCPVWRLTSSPYAKDIERRAIEELDRVLTGSPLERDVLGHLTAAGGGVTAVDLAALGSVTVSEVDAMLSSRLGRCVTSQDRQLAFSHTALAETARERLGPALMRYHDRLRTWAHEYREREWPADTPRYLLHGYPRLLASIGDRDAMVALATDKRRHDLMFEITGSDSSARAELRAAQDLVRNEPQPDPTTLLTLAIRGDTLTIRSEFPVEALAAWARLGHINRAEAVIRSFADDAPRIRCLIDVATAVTKAGDPERAADLADQAEAILSGLDDHEYRTALAVDLAIEAAERGDHTRADRLSRTVEPLFDHIRNQGARAAGWAELSKAAAKAGDQPRARTLATRSDEVAQAIDEPALRLRSRAAHAAAVRTLGDKDRADALLQAIETEIHDLEKEEDRGWALARLVAVHAEAGDLDRADHLARELLEDHHRCEAWKSLVKAFAHAGEYEHARVLADEIPHDTDRASAFAMLARIEATDRDSAERDLTRAIAVAQENNRVAVTTRVVSGLADSGFEQQALLLAETLPTPNERDSILTDLADRYAAKGDFRRAKATINRIANPDKRKLQIVAMLCAQAEKRWIKWYRRNRLKAVENAHAIRSHSDAAYAFAFIAGISAKLRDPDWYAACMDQAEKRLTSVEFPDTQASVLKFLVVVATGLGDEARATVLNERRNEILAKINSVQTRESLVNEGLDKVLAERDWAAAEDIIRRLVFRHYRDQGLLSMANVLSEDGDYDHAERVARDIEDVEVRGEALLALTAEAAEAADERTHRLAFEILTTPAWPKTIGLLNEMEPRTVDMIVAAYPPSTVADSPRVRSAPWALVQRRRAEQEAEREYRAAAEAGDIEAMVELGELLFDENRQEAQRWLRTAAEADHNIAMSLLALALGAENAEAWEWGRRAVESNDPVAMHNFAFLQEEVTEAERWARIAAQTGFTPAMVYLGDVLAQQGKTAEAEAWYRKAADNGDLNGMRGVACCLMERDETAAAESLLRTVAEQGDARAMVILGVLFENDMNKKAEALRWYVHAAEREDPDAMYFLGLHFDELNEPDEAEHWLQKAAEAGQTDAATHLSKLLQEKQPSS